jgi:hypothetical protein
VLDRPEREAYLARLEDLAGLERRAQRRGEAEPSDLLEWLVATVEDPLTRAEATDELRAAVRALGELAAESGTGADLAALDLQVLVDRFRQDGGTVSQEPPAALVGAFLADSHRQRLAAALGATERLRQDDLELFQIVRTWDRDTAVRWLVRQLRDAAPTEGLEGTWWLAGLADDLGDESLGAIVDRADDREKEIGARWPDDESQATEKLRQDARAELARELRRQLADALARSLSP